jgi:hypothetical protein
MNDIQKKISLIFEIVKYKYAHCNSTESRFNKNLHYCDFNVYFLATSKTNNLNYNQQTWQILN